MIARSLLEVSDTDLRGGPLGLLFQQEPSPEIRTPASWDVIRNIEDLKGMLVEFRHEVAYEHMLFRLKLEDLTTPKPGFWKRLWWRCKNWIRRK